MSYSTIIDSTYLSHFVDSDDTSSPSWAVGVSNSDFNSLIGMVQKEVKGGGVGVFHLLPVLASQSHDDVDVL